MVKQKPRYTRRAPRKNHLNEDSINSFDEGDWTVVKKQKITILIPPLPNKANPTMPTVGKGRQHQENSVTTNSVHETRQSESFSPEPDIRLPPILHPSEPSVASDDSPLISWREDRGSKGIMISGDSSVFLDRRMRASCLEKKLKKAGGLENWLVSLGLDHFVKVFRARSVNKFQLANLTMKKLKDMGTNAVGPRRKLMHAIDCLCVPHCFQNS